MCYKGKCMHCLEVETGALIFAILNVMSSALASVVSIGGLVYTMFITEMAINKADEQEDENFMEGALVFGLTTNVLFAGLAVGSCIAFSFAVVLIVGLCKRKANLVKCYFVFGVLKLVVGVVTLIYLALQSAMAPAMLFFVIYFFYGLILIMVRMTYMKFESEIAFTAFTNPMSGVSKF